jgi:hypothetical protein
LRFVIVTSCWVIALTLFTQVVIWSLCSFTDLRFSETEKLAGDAPLIIDNGTDTGVGRGAKQSSRWRPEVEAEEQERQASSMDRVFRVAVTVARTMGLMSAIIVCPLLCLGVLLAVPAGAPRVERAVNALTWSIVLVLLILPLGGWFGMAWQQGTITDYAGLVQEADAGQANGFTPAFYARFLLMPAASAVGFFLVGLQFSSAVAAVLLKRDGLDPELEAEATNVAATSLHGTGRSAGALSAALHAQKQKKRAPSMSKMSPGEMPKRLI